MLKCCIIGAGFVAGLHALAYHASPDALLCGIADVNEAQAQALAAQYEGCAAFADAEAMLKTIRPDVVSVCIPTYLHADAVVLAASYGAHVLCEKPLALTDADCQRMLEAEKTYGVQIMTAQVLRWWPEYRAAQEIYARGEIGRLQTMSAARLLCAGRGGWFADPAKSGGALFDILAHDMDFTIFLLGDDIDKLYAVGRQNEAGAWQHIQAVLTYCNGTRVCLEAGNDCPKGFPFTTQLRLLGEAGCVEAGATSGQNIGVGVKTNTSLTVLKNGVRESVPALAEGVNAQEFAFTAEIQAFLDGVKAGETPIPLKQSAQVIRLLNLVGRSMAGEGEIRDVGKTRLA